MGNANRNRSGYAPEKITYGINRYGNETRRLYRVMDEHLAKSPHGYLVGDRVTIADISCWGWVASHSTCQSFPLPFLSPFPHLNRQQPDHSSHRAHMYTIESVKSRDSC